MEKFRRKYFTVLILSTMLLSVSTMATVGDLSSFENDGKVQINLNDSLLKDQIFPEKECVDNIASTKVQPSLQKKIDIRNKEMVKIIVLTTDVAELARLMSHYEYKGLIGTRSSSTHRIAVPILEVPSFALLEIASLPSVIGIYEYQSPIMSSKSKLFQEEIENSIIQMSDDVIPKIVPNTAFTMHHGAEDAWANGFNGTEVIVALIGSGVDFGHYEIEGRQARVTDPMSNYSGWPIAFDPSSMSTYLSTGFADGTWYVNTTSTDLHIYHTVVVDGTNDFWVEKNLHKSANSTYALDLTSEIKAFDPKGTATKDMSEVELDLTSLYLTMDEKNLYIGFDATATNWNMTYGVYIDTSSGGATSDPLQNYIDAISTHRPEYVIYARHIGVDWGWEDANKTKVWSKNDTLENATLYSWNGFSWDDGQCLINKTQIGGQQAYGGDFIEFAVPLLKLNSPAQLSFEIFTTGDNRSHAQDTTPSDSNVAYNTPDWSTTTTTLSNFTTIKTPPEYVTTGTSISGVYHIGLHPDKNLEEHHYGRPIAVLLVDKNSSGIYDTVYMDLDNDKNFTDEKPCHIGNECAYKDLDSDGGEGDGEDYPDVSGGMVYFIADGVIPIPYSDIYCDRNGIENNVIPENGSLVCVIGDFNLDASQGTECASTIIAKGKGVDGNGNVLVRGMAPNATLISIRSANIFEEWYFAVEGYDGEIGTEDDAHIVCNTLNYPNYEDGWDIYSRFADYITTYYAKGKSIFTAGAGDVGPGYGTLRAPSSSPGVITCGVATQFDYRNYNPDAPKELGRVYADYGPNAQYGEVLPSSGRGPSMLGQPEPDVVSVGSFAFGSLPLNTDQNFGPTGPEFEWFGGQWAWDLWSGSALSSSVTAGTLALIYDAYHQTNGEYPNATTARSILMSGADNMNYDVLVQGSGYCNADRSTEIASNIYGLYLSPSFWVPGDYRGTEYEMFPKLMYPGNSDECTFTIKNHDQKDSASVEIYDAIFHKSGEYTIPFNISKSYDDLDDPGIINIEPYIPQGAELLKVTAYTEYRTGMGYMLEIFDWTDVNWNKILEFPQEQNRMTYGIGENIVEVRCRDPLSRAITGLAVQLKAFNTNIEVNEWTLKLEFYEKMDWDWIELTNCPTSIDANGTTMFTANLTVPPNAKIGSYEGGIYIINKISYQEFVKEGTGNAVENETIKMIGSLGKSGRFKNYPVLENTWELFQQRYFDNETVVYTANGSDLENFYLLHGDIVSSPGYNHSLYRLSSGWERLQENINYTLEYDTGHVTMLTGLLAGDEIYAYYNCSKIKLEDGMNYTVYAPETGYIKFYTPIDINDYTVIGNYIWDLTGGVWNGLLNHSNVVKGTYSVYKDDMKWLESEDIIGELIINDSFGGNTSARLNHDHVVRGTYDLYLNGAEWSEFGGNIVGEVVVDNATQDQTDAQLAHGNIIPGSATLSINGHALTQIRKIPAGSEEHVANATSIGYSETVDDFTEILPSPPYPPGWYGVLDHNYWTMEAIKSWIIYKNGTPMVNGWDYVMFKNSDGIYEGLFRFKEEQYDPTAVYTANYTYYDPTIQWISLDHGNVVSGSEEVFKNGELLLREVHYQIYLSNGTIWLRKPLVADDIITARYSYNTYLLNIKSGDLTITDGLNAGDELTASYSYNNYLLDLESGSIEFANPLNPGDLVTADYTYRNYQMDLVKGNIEFSHVLYPGSIMKCIYSYYHTVIPVLVNVASNTLNFTFGGNTSIAQDLHNNSMIGGGCGFEGEGDWRFYYVDILEEGFYENPPTGLRLLIDVEWENPNTDVDVLVFGKTEPSKNPITRENLPSERYGAYTLNQVEGGSEETAEFFTTTGGPEEIVAPRLSGGLNVIALHAVRINGTAHVENISGKIGTLNVNPPELKIVTNELSGRQEVTFHSNMNWQGIGGIAAGPSAPESYKNMTVYQDDPDWSHFPNFESQLASGSTSVYVTLKDCLIFDVHIYGHVDFGYKDVGDLDLGIFLDANGDGITQPGEFVAMDADADADEHVKLIKPVDGNYIIRPYGFTLIGVPAHYDIDITVVQGKGFGIEGEHVDTISDPSEFKSVDFISPNTLSTLNLTWDLPGSTEDGTMMGAFYIGPGNAPMCLLLSIELTIDRLTPSFSNLQVMEDDGFQVNYIDNITTNDNTPTLSVTVSDSDRGELDSSSIKVYIDREDMTPWTKVNIPFADPDGQEGSLGYGYWIGMVTYTPSVPLSDGGHDITVEVGDLAGNIATEHWTFTIDTQAPSLIIDTPSADLSTNVNVTTISGTTTPGATIFIRGNEVEVKEDGSFSKEERLEEGINEIPITAVDWFDWDDVKGLIPGNTATITRVITLDTTKPRFSRITTSTTSITNKDSTTIIGKIEDERSEDVILTVNDILTAVNSDGTFMATLLLEEEGENEINIIATDSAGNTNETSRIIIKDTTAPILTVEALTPTQGRLTVKGTTEQGAALTINGKPVPVVNGAFNKEIDLSYGANLIVIESKDVAGNVEEIREVVMYSSMPVIGFLPLSLMSMIVLLLIGLFVGYVLLGRIKISKKIEEEEVTGEVWEEEEEPGEELEVEEEIEKEAETEEEEIGKESEEEKEGTEEEKGTGEEETSEKDLEELGKELFGET